MIHKIGNVKGLNTVPNIDKDARKIILEFANILTHEYGENRDIDKDYGGFVLYAEPGTSIGEVKAKFDYTRHTMEFIERSFTEPYIYTILYLTSCEYGVVIVMYEDDAPDEFRKAFKECNHEEASNNHRNIGTHCYC